MRSSYRWVALAAVLSVGLAACGDDGDADGDTSEAAGATTTTAETGLGTEPCEAYVRLASAVFAVPEGPDAGSFIEENVLPELQALSDAEADEIAEPVETMLGIATESVEDPARFDDPAAEDAFFEVGGAVHEGCGFDTADVTAVDYGFEGVPESVPAGTVSFSLTNDGTEDHEMVLFRKADGETRPIEELLALDEAEAEEAMTFTTVGFASPGATGYVATDLEAGQYAMVCFIPVGGAEDGPPHFTEGMVSEFEVA
jgi:hypothetical protein